MSQDQRRPLAPVVQVISTVRWSSSTEPGRTAARRLSIGVSCVLLVAVIGHALVCLLIISNWVDIGGRQLRAYRAGLRKASVRNLAWVAIEHQTELVEHLVGLGQLFGVGVWVSDAKLAQGVRPGQQAESHAVFDVVGFFARVDH